MTDAMLEDDWYAVVALDERTFAIGEPLYHQRNWSYLFVGDTRALLFDTGSYYGDMRGVVARRIGPRPLTVLPSHMHYDHLGNVERFETIALPDLPVLRDCTLPSGKVQPVEPLFLGDRESREPPVFPVRDWIAIGGEIDLGGRKLALLHTPGHSPDSVLLWEAEAGRLFAADFLYPGDLYAQVPGASLRDYLDTAQRVAGVIGPQTEIYGAHGLDGPDGAPPVPRLSTAHLDALIAHLQAVRNAPPSFADAATVTQKITDDLSIIIDRKSLEGFGSG